MPPISDGFLSAARFRRFRACALAFPTFSCVRAARFRPFRAEQVLSILPIDFFEFAFDGYRGLLRCNRLIRWPQLMAILHEMAELWLGRHAMMVIELIAILAVQIHLIACTWFAYGVTEGLDGSDWNPSLEVRRRVDPLSCAPFAPSPPLFRSHSS